MKQDKIKEKDTTNKKKKTDSIRTDNICVGQVFKNYKDLCINGLNIIPQSSGKARILQEKKINEYISFIKEGHKIIITEIKEIENKRGSCGKYNKLINDALTIIMYTHRHNKQLYITKSELMCKLGLINENFTDCRTHINSISYMLKIDELFLSDFFKNNYDRTNWVLKTNLDKFMESTQCCSLEDVVLLKYEDDKTKIATTKDIEIIEKCEDKALEELELKNREELQYKNKWLAFINKTTFYLKQHEEFKQIKHYYKLYRFTINPVKVNNLYKNLKETCLNVIANKINKESRTACKQSITTRQENAKKRLLKDVYEDKTYKKDRDTLLNSEKAAEFNNICMNRFIKITATKIDIDKAIRVYNKKKKTKSKLQTKKNEEVIPF